MRRRHTKLIAAIILCTSSLLSIRAAETGDFDGDGRLSMADVLHWRSGEELAPGSLDGFESHRCYGASRIENTLGRDVLGRDVPIWNLKF